MAKVTAMAFITRSLSIALSLSLLACAGDPQGSTIRSARIDGDDRLELDLDLRFTETELTALDQGIPLRVAVHSADTHVAQQIIELRFRPLARQYELLLPGQPVARLFASRPRLLAALDRVVVDGGRAQSGEVRLALIASALPAPLRLPAMIDHEWQLATPPLQWSR